MIVRNYYAALLQLLLALLAFTRRTAYGVRCFHCDNQYGSCNSGECSGLACIMIEAITNQKKSVQKGCLQFLDRPRCIKADLMGIETVKCTCSSDFCNGDEQLLKNDLVHRLQSAMVNGGASNADRSKRTNYGAATGLQMSRNNLLMLIFMCLFITGSFSLLVFNTLCLQITTFALLVYSTT